MLRSPRPSPLHALGALTLLFAVALACAAGAGAATPLGFSSDSTADVAVPEGVTYKFRLTKRDRRALAAQRRSQRKRQRAEQARSQQSIYAARIARIESLIEEARASEGALRLRVQTRLVQRYKDAARGTGDDLSFLLAAEGVGDAIDRTSLLGAQDRQDDQVMAEYEVTAERLEQLELALEQMQKAEENRALALEDQADQLAEPVHDAADHRLHTSTKRKVRSSAGHDGKWLVAPDTGFGFGLLAAYPGQMGKPWNGGHRAPPRPATAAQLAAVLSDPRIDIYAGGRIDISAGRVDGRVVDALRAMADRFGSVRVTSLITGHGIYTSSGNISMHTLGCAVDIGSVGGQIIQSATQGPGSITEQSVLFLAGLPGDLAPHQVISLYSYGGATLGMGDHDDHIHLGYSC